MQAFCLKCRESVVIVNASQFTMRSKAVGIRGICPRGHKVMAVVPRHLCGNGTDGAGMASWSTTPRDGGNSDDAIVKEGNRDVRQ